MDEIKKVMAEIKKVDPYLGKFFNWLLTISFFRIKIVWQILIGLSVLLLPLQALLSLIDIAFNTFALRWSVGGILIGTLTIAATAFLVKYYFFDNGSEFRLSGLGIWSKAAMFCYFGGQFLSGLVTLFSRVSVRGITSAIISLAFYVVCSYLAVFGARYFTDVVIHGNSQYAEEIVIEK